MTKRVAYDHERDFSPPVVLELDIGALMIVSEVGRRTSDGNTHLLSPVF